MFILLMKKKKGGTGNWERVCLDSTPPSRALEVPGRILQGGGRAVLQGGDFLVREPRLRCSTKLFVLVSAEVSLPSKHLSNGSRAPGPRWLVLRLRYICQGT